LRAPRFARRRHSLAHRSSCSARRGEYRWRRARNAKRKTATTGPLGTATGSARNQRGIWAPTTGLERAEGVSGEMRSAAMEYGFTDGEAACRPRAGSVNCGEMRAACARTGTRDVVVAALGRALTSWMRTEDAAELSRALTHILTLLADTSPSAIHRSTTNFLTRTPLMFGLGLIVADAFRSDPSAGRNTIGGSTGWQPAGGGRMRTWNASFRVEEPARSGMARIAMTDARIASAALNRRLRGRRSMRVAVVQRLPSADSASRTI